MPVVVAGRALQGLGSGAFGTTMYVVIGRAYPEALRPLLVRLHHQSATVAGLPPTAGGLAWTATSWSAGRLRDRVGSTVAVSAGITGVMAGVVGVIASVSQPAALGIAMAAWAVAGAGMGLACNLVSVTVVDQSPAGEEGVTASGVQLTDALGVAIGTGVGGGLVALGTRTSWGLSPALVAQFALNAGVAAGSLGLGARLVLRRGRAA